MHGSIELVGNGTIGSVCVSRVSVEKWVKIFSGNEEIKPERFRWKTILYNEVLCAAVTYKWKAF